MSKYAFGDIAINSKEKKKPEPSDTATYIGLEHLDSGCLKVRRFGAEVAPIGDKLVMRKGDVLFGKRRAYQKKVAIAPFDGIFSAHGMVLRPKTDVIDKDFFPLFIASDYFLNAAIKISVGSLSPTINWNDLKLLEFSLPPLEEQRKLARVLWTAIELKEAYQKLLAQCDEMASSRFIEMFGDPAENPKGWYQTPIGNILEGKASNGFFANREEYVEKGNAAVIGVANVVNRMYSQIEGLPEVLVGESDIKKYSVKYGDILFCRSSLVKEGIAKASIIPHEVAPNTLFECHVIRLPLDPQKAIPEFIQMQTTTPFFREQVISQSKTATMTTISQDGILKTKIIVPPLALQNEFTAFIEDLDKSKVELQKSISTLDAMVKVLLQDFLSDKGN